MIIARLQNIEKVLHFVMICGIIYESFNETKGDNIMQYILMSVFAILLIGFIYIGKQVFKIFEVKQNKHV